MDKNTGQPLTAEPAMRRRLEPGERRAQLLEQAISAFADAGIERAVHADVAARAKVSTPTVFKYFPSREALVDAVLSEVEQSLESLRTQLPPDICLTPAELTRAMSGILTALCRERPDLMKVALMWSVAFSPVRARYLSFQIRLQTMLAALLDPNVSDKSDPLIIYALAKLVIHMHFDGTEAGARGDYVNRMCEVFDAALVPTR